jgi:hypothetical protein
MIIKKIFFLFVETGPARQSRLQEANERRRKRTNTKTDAYPEMSA